MNLWEIITVSPDIQSGVPVFKGTRVPVIGFLDHIKKGIPVSEFIEDFPSVSKEQALQLLDYFKETIMTSGMNKINEDINRRKFA